MNRMNLKAAEESSLDIPSYEEICKNSVDESDDSYQKNRRQRALFAKKKDQDLSSVKIKTLAEIRAEKKLREEQEKKLSSPASNNVDLEISSTNAEVTSTSRTEEMAVDDKKEDVAQQHQGVKRKSNGGTEEQIIRKKPKLRRPPIIDSDNTVSSVGESDKDEKNDGKRKESRSDASKLDEMLLLDEDDFECSNVSLQAEEDLLKDIDELLSD